MTTAVQDILSRAIGYSAQSNTPDLYPTSAEIISAVAAFERDIYRVANAQTRYFAVTTSVNSSNASAARTADLSALSPGVERIIRVTLPSGTWVSQVDLEDTDAELAPRYYVLGQVLTEVGSDWGTSGVVALSVTYGQKPATLDPTGSLTQTVTLPDEFTDLLWIRLANYFATKDTGRDPAEAQTLDALYQARMKAAIDAMNAFGGLARRRFLAPFEIPGGSE